MKIDGNQAAAKLVETLTQPERTASAVQVKLLRKMLDTQKEQSQELAKLLHGPGQKLDIRA